MHHPSTLMPHEVRARVWGGPVPCRQHRRGQGHAGCHEASTQRFTRPSLGFTTQLRTLAGCFGACCMALPATGRGFLGLGGESRSCTSTAAQLRERHPRAPSSSSHSQRSLCKPFLRADTSPCQAVLLPSCSHSSPTGLPARTSTHSRILPLRGSSQPRPVTQSWLQGTGSTASPQAGPSALPAQRDNPKVLGHGERTFWDTRADCP